ncbi:MAG: nickel pincer cofactor biosynthesis protein LarC [Candidatus Omnitrophota bacterium]
MKILYFDLVGGISGDMIVSALVDLGVSRKALSGQLSKLGIKGCSLKFHSVQRGHLKALKFDVLAREPKNFSYREIGRLIQSSELASGVKKRALAVYETLKKAEEHVHGRSEDMHFHQLGEIDSIVDIVCACIGLELLGVADILYSVIPLGLKTSGAVSRMLEGQRVYFTDWAFENVTPTGMAFLKTLGRQVRQGTHFLYGRSGLGAGANDPFEVGNVVRVAELAGAQTAAGEEILVMEANVDDLNPQVFPLIFERLFAAGALDVFVQNVLMKKSRPGFLLTCLSDRGNFDRMAAIVFRETSTIGLRYYPVSRLKLERSTARVSVLGQGVRIKNVVTPSGSKRGVPEYEDCLAVARKTGRPLVEIMELAKRKV